MKSLAIPALRQKEGDGMLSNYILRHEDALYCFYHTEEKGILCKVYQNNRWSGARVIVEGARENYSVTPGQDGRMYLFCQDVQGDIVLSTFGDHKWSSRIVLKNRASRIHTVILSPIITEKGLCIIYNMPPGEERSNYLVMQQLSENGQWSAASRIDTFTEMNGAIYQVQHTSGGHLLLFYQTRTNESTLGLGYREMTATRQGGFQVFHTTNYYIIDTSFLTTNNGVHVLYIIKSMFSCQLIYRHKTEQRFSNPIILAEGQKLENCLLSIVGDNLYATFSNNSQLYVCISEDKGNNFSRAVKYKKKFCLNPIKATYITTVPMQENKMFIRHVYVDKSCPWDVQLISDLYEDFYPVLETQGTPAPIPESSDDMDRLRNQITLHRKQTEEKDQQIMRMAALLKAKNDEIMLVETQKKNVGKRMAEELEELKRKLGELEKENKALKGIKEGILNETNEDEL